MMKGLAAILAILAVAAANERPSSCDMDRGEPVCLDKMASYSACLGPELAARFSTAALQCHFGGGDEESDEEDVVDSDEDEGDDEESDEEGIVASERQRPAKGKGKKGKGKKGKGKGKGRKGGKGKKGGKGRPGKGGKGSSSSEEEDSDVFDIVNFVRNDVEERTCVYRAMGWVCEESGEVDLDKMREDISTAFMGFDFDWKSALLTCSAVKFPMLCSLTERVQEDLDIAGFDVDLDMVIHRLSPEERRELGHVATPLGFFNCAMAAFHAGCKATVEDMLLGA